MLVEQRKIYLLDVILTFLPISLALCVVWYAPETIVSRFDLEGNVVATASRWTILILPIFILLLSGLIKWIDCKGLVGSQNKEISRYIFRVTLLLFNAIAFFQFFLILTGYSMVSQMGRLMAFLIGVFMIFIGNVSPKIKETNKHFGFRVPWIMNNDEAFRKTQRFFGFASTISGVIFIVISLFVLNQLVMILVSIVLVLTIGITAVYSYKTSK
ncbi:SdpI family protein [uncultured Granulicatella sp.]|uniref:SdpI family protein n=1 Tax=uncultured Granulicatella sp. TaxID=316089 RepID=UPI0028DCB109|nr:SdpI family protein [uncultured Granulicatella sp.]